MMAIRNGSVAVVGLGKLGLPWACLLASKGYWVRGIDCNGAIVERIEHGVLDSIEPELNELIAQWRPQLALSSRFDSVHEADIAFVVVPTPSEENDRFSLRYVLSAVTESQRGHY